MTVTWEASGPGAFPRTAHPGGLLPAEQRKMKMGVLSSGGGEGERPLCVGMVIDSGWWVTDDFGFLYFLFFVSCHQQALCSQKQTPSGTRDLKIKMFKNLLKIICLLEHCVGLSSEG